MHEPETQLVAMLLREVDRVKHEHADWRSPHRLSRALGVRLEVASLGAGREGAALADTIVVDIAASGLGRQQFTLYHEIVHHLIKRDDELLSILHDQYPSEEDFDRICERLCNVGAAEFLLPRDIVLSAISDLGFSLSLLISLRQVTSASLTAICVQLVLCATHRCIGVTCRPAKVSSDAAPLLQSETPDRVQLSVEMAVSSANMAYGVARGVIIPRQHLLSDAEAADEGQILKGKDAIPFRHARRPWIVDCEAVRFGSQVFGIFHADSPPQSHRDQLSLF